MKIRNETFLSNFQTLWMYFNSSLLFFWKTEKINDDKLQSLFWFFLCKMQRFREKIFLFFEDLNADQIWSDDLSGLDDLITLEFPSDLGGFLTTFCGIFDRLEGVSIQSHLSFDVSAIRSIFFKLFVQLELQLHTFQNCWGLEVESLGVSVISDLKQKRKCQQRIHFFKVIKNIFSDFLLTEKNSKKIRETLFTFWRDFFHDKIENSNFNFVK